MEPEMLSGGIHPVSFKQLTRAQPIQNFPLPQKVVIPLSQHTGAPAGPVVKKGDLVALGDLIGQPESFVSSAYHASLAGKITAIEPWYLPSNRRSLAIVIEADGSDRRKQSSLSDWKDLTPSEIVERVKAAGIVGMGGAAFPTHVKLSVPPGRTAEMVILNACECEPFLTCDEQVLREETSQVLEGLQVICRATGVSEAVIAMEGSKGALEALVKACFAEREWPARMRLEILPERYPQGSEKQLIEAVTGRQVPSGKLPIDVGCLVFNVQTSLAVLKAVRENWPVVDRVLTVSGLVDRPVNLRVPVGTLVADILDYLGIKVKAGQKLVMGGPMMGVSIPDKNVPILKGTSGLLVLGQREGYSEQAPCIRCGRCLEACPMGLVPAEMGRQARTGNWDRCAQLNVNDCIECGCCSYVCPSKLPLVAWFKWAK
ncbi:MAG: electron transport complex subunit RsxC, partial [Candidatus Omnitrophica bacterium]|nr:electron transport complex subunit RsxC [Candidatus Omnitrophota bacterium]